MKPITINYAYDGVLYAPLFLAHDLGLLPRNVELKFRNGDLPTIQSLSQNHDAGNNWFAICDPFAKDISRVQRELGRDQLVIVGGLIERLPIWLYNTHPDIDRIDKETDLREYRHLIHTVRCYEHYNTGYLIGQRILQVLGLPSSALVECAFGEEFPPEDDPNTLVVTSDFLSLVPAMGDQNIIFTYPQRCPELDPYLFTAVLTLRSVIEEHLYAVLSVLASLRTAINYLSRDHLPEEYLDLLTKRFGTLVTESDNALKQSRIAAAIEMLCRTERIYSESFKIKEAQQAYETARTEWARVVRREFPPASVCSEPIPALLVNRGWPNDPSLIEVFVKKFMSRPSLWPSQLPTSSIVVLMLAFLGIILASIFTAYTWLHLHPATAIYFWLVVAFFCVQGGSTAWLAWDVIRNLSQERVKVLGGTILSFFLGGVGVAIKILK